MKVLNVLIVGAGIGGLTHALCLSLAGHRNPNLKDVTYLLLPNFLINQTTHKSPNFSNKSFLRT